MQGYLWIIWVKLAGVLWIIGGGGGGGGGELGSSLIFYFVAIDDRRTMPKHILAWGTGAPAASNK